MKNRDIVIIAFGMGAGVATALIWFFINYQLQSPLIIRLQSPVVKRVSVTPTPHKPVVEPTKAPAKKKEVHIIKEVYAAETTTPPNDQEIANYIKSKDWDYSIAIRIAKSENFWNLTKSFDCGRTGKRNSNGTVDHGLWQINEIHIKSGAITLEDANDCFKATDFAYGLYKARGNFSAWSAYNNGSYKNHSDEI